MMNDSNPATGCRTDSTVVGKAGKQFVTPAAFTHLRNSSIRRTRTWNSMHRVELQCPGYPFYSRLASAFSCCIRTSCWKQDAYTDKRKLFVMMASRSVSYACWIDCCCSSSSSRASDSCCYCCRCRYCCCSSSSSSSSFRLQ
jgi:hypothetical protein